MALKDLKRWDWKVDKNVRGFTSTHPEDGRWVQYTDIKADIIKTCKEIEKEKGKHEEKVYCNGTFCNVCDEYNGMIIALMEWAGIKESDLK